MKREDIKKVIKPMVEMYYRSEMIERNMITSTVISNMKSFIEINQLNDHDFAVIINDICTELNIKVITKKNNVQNIHGIRMF